MSKRYDVTYVSGATGYGWEQDMTGREMRDFVKSMSRVYTAAVEVWDKEKHDFVYWKRVLTYTPEINKL